MSPQKKIVKQSDNAAGARSPARNAGSDPRESYQNASAKKSYQNQSALMSPVRRKDFDHRHNASGGDRLKAPVSAVDSALAALGGGRRPGGDEAQKAEDSAERAFLELQDAKVNFFQEKTDHDTKMQQRRTFTNGFSIN